jgi:endonuclease/exonuclease/phosphatase (EEP) superfamily protein YafD
MRLGARLLGAALVLSYVGGIAAWLVARTLLADSRWWGLALANTFAIYLYLPLLPLGWIAWRVGWRGIAATLLIPLLACAWMFGGLLLPTPPPAIAGPTFTLMTFNIHAGYNHPDNVIRLIQEVQPDIVMLQEVGGWQFAELQSALRPLYPYQAPPKGYASGLMCVFSRYPILSAEWPPLRHVWRGAQHVVVEIEGQPVHLLNLHLTSSSGVEYLRHARWYLQQTYAQRELEARSVSAYLASLEGPVIVAGDLNTTAQTTAYRILADGLDNAFAAAGWGTGHTYPAQPQRWMGWPTPARIVRIDHILYSHHLVALHAAVGSTRGGSDHLPVIAQLAFR